MRCKNCHYSLVNLSQNRCPECGCAFDPNDSSTFEVESPRNRRLLVRALILIGISYLVSYGCCYQYLSAYSNRVGVQWTTSRMLRDSLSGGLRFLPLSLAVVLLVYMISRLFWGGKKS